MKNVKIANIAFIIYIIVVGLEYILLNIFPDFFFILFLFIYSLFVAGFIKNKNK